MKVTRLLPVVLVTFASMVMAPSAFAVALVAYYDFDGMDAADLSGNGNDGAVGSAVGFSTDVPTAIGNGYSAIFDGTSGNNGLITVPNSPTLQAIDNSLSVAFWIKMDHTANPNWVRVTRKASEANGTDGWMITRHNNNSDLLMRTDTTGPGGAFNRNRGQGVGVGMLDGEWHHYVHIRNNGIWTEYVDGVQTGTGAYPHGDGFSNTQPLLIGGRGQNMIGQLDDYSIWNGALTSDQVTHLASGGSAIPEPVTGGLAMFGFGAMLLTRRRRAA